MNLVIKIFPETRILEIASVISVEGYAPAKSIGIVSMPNPDDKVLGVLMENIKKEKNWLEKIFDKNHPNRLFLGCLHLKADKVWTFEYFGKRRENEAMDFAKIICKEFDVTVNFKLKEYYEKWETYYER
jgi:hypothetical protein